MKDKRQRGAGGHTEPLEVWRFAAIQVQQFWTMSIAKRRPCLGPRLNAIETASLDSAPPKGRRWMSMLRCMGAMDANAFRAAVRENALPKVSSLTYQGWAHSKGECGFIAACSPDKTTSKLLYHVQLFLVISQVNPFPQVY